MLKKQRAAIAGPSGERLISAREWSGPGYGRLHGHGAGDCTAVDFSISHDAGTHANPHTFVLEHTKISTAQCSSTNAVECFRECNTKRCKTIARAHT